MNSLSPFKYLYSYSNTRKDFDHFFGRGQEIKSVKSQLAKTKFLIVYGPSGSGKTSLLNAGILYPLRTKEKAILSLRFNFDSERKFNSIFDKITEKWGEEIGNSLKDTFEIKCQIVELESRQKIFKENLLLKKSKLKSDSNEFFEIKKKIKELHLEYSEMTERLDLAFTNLYQDLNQVPVLKLDQFEELFIFHGTSDGFVDNFGILLDVLLNNSLPIKIFLFVRSDYFGHLVHLERYFPKVFYPKVLVDMPGRITLKAIINELFAKFNINTEHNDDSDSVIENILNNIRVNRGEELFEHTDLYFLPFLQIYLDSLYQIVFKETYKGEVFDNNNLKEVLIKNDHVKRIGPINKVLLRLIGRANVSILKDSKSLSNISIKKRIQKVKLPATLLLKKLVSSKKTKKRMFFPGGKFSPEDTSYLLSSFLFDEKLSYEEQHSVLEIMLDELVDNRLVIKNDKDQYLELVHDSLAEFISTIVVDKDEHFLLAQKFVADYELHKSYKKQNEEFYLDNDIQDNIGNIDKLEKCLADSDIDITEEFKRFWNESFKFNKKAAIRKKRIRLFVFSALLIGLLASLFFLFQAQLEKQKTENAKSNTELEVEKNKKEGDLFQSVGVAYGKGKFDLTSAFDSLKLDTVDLLVMARENMKDTLGVFDRIKNLFGGKTEEVHDTTKLLKMVEEKLMDDKFAIRRQYFEELENNLYKKPFYRNSLDFRRADDIILSTKTRKYKGSEDTLIIYAHSPDHLHQYIYDLSNDKVFEEQYDWPKRVSSFEPFSLNDKSQVLISSENTLVLLDDNLNEEHRSQKVEQNFSLIEKLENDIFLCLLDDNKSLYKYSLSKDEIFPFNLSSYLGFNIRSIFKITYLKNTKEIILGVKSKQDKDWIIKIGPNNFIGGISFQNWISIKNIKVMKNGEIYLADASSIYKINASQIGDSFSNKELNQPIIIHDSDENGEIKTIDIENNKFIIGTQGNIAQTYINEGKSFKSAIKKQTLIGHSDALVNVSFVKDGEFAFTSGQGGSIKVWNLKDKSIERSVIPSKNNGISMMRYRDNALYVGYRLINSISEYGPGYIAEFDESLTLNEKYYYRGKKNYKQIELPVFDFEKNGELAASTFWGKEVRSAQAAGSMIASIGPEVNFCVRDVCIVDSLMILATNNGIKKFVKIGDKYEHQVIETDLIYSVQINAVDYDKNTNRIIGAGDDGKVYIWDLTNSKIRTLQDHHDKISDVIFSPDGSYFVSGSWDNRAIVWKNDSDLESIKTEYQIKVHISDIEDVEISPDNIIATASSDNTVQLHKVFKIDNIFRVKRLPSLINHDYSIRAVTFGENSNILYTGDKKGIIKKWNRTNFLDN